MSLLVAAASERWDYADQTVLHPLGFALALAAGFAMLVVPRRYAIWPMLIIVCFVAPAQRVTILDLDFNLPRILVLFGWVRLIAHGELRGFRWKPIDTAFTAWSIVSTVASSVQVGTALTVINRLGACFDAFGMYFLFRCIIRDWSDVRIAIRGFVLLSVPTLVAFLIESSTGRNLFAFFGGVPEITLERDGRLRCQGAFSHPILAGCFWASVMPLIAAGWWAARPVRGRIVAPLGVCGAIVVLSASSTPVMSIIFAAVGGGAFLFRRHMRAIRWGIALTLCVLHVVMMAPVWHLIARINIVSGNTGWHRYHLIDQAINRVGEWWLIGTSSTAHWGWGLADVTNQYVLEGVRAGMGGLILFVATIVLAFSGVGRMWRSVRPDPERIAIAWALGVMLFMHCMNFMSVSYFGQTIVIWYLTLAMVGSLSPLPAAAVRRAPGGSAPGGVDPQLRLPARAG